MKPAMFGFVAGHLLYSSITTGDLMDAFCLFAMVVAIVVDFRESVSGVDK